MSAFRCRVCDRQNISLILDLGQTALANRFLAAPMLAEPEPKFPLRLVRCHDCGLVQIDETVPPKTLFGHYLYLSQTSDAVKRHAEHLARTFVQRYGLKPGELVMEAASNDGTVLQQFALRGLRTLGVEPAENIAAMARAAGIETASHFFSEPTARHLREKYGPARLVLARHVLAHVAALADFVQALAHVISDDGLVVVEFPHLLPFFQKLEYDQVYHEHLCYFSVRVVAALFARHGLQLIDVEEIALHGGSVVLAAQKQGGPYTEQKALAELLAREEAAGLHTSAAWGGFAQRVERSRELLLAELDRLKKLGQRFAGYGAAAKGMTLLAYCGIDARHLPWIADKSPLKHGRFTPGHHIPVVGPERLLAEQPDVVMLLAWNFAEEIAEQQAEYLRRDGKFLIPLPEPRYQ
jgi:hypothetical protein